MNSTTLIHYPPDAETEPLVEPSYASHPQHRERLSFSARLTLMIVSLVLISVMLVAGLVYTQYRQSFTQATVNQLQGTGEMMAGAFTQWLDARVKL